MALKTIPVLSASDVDCRVQSVKATKNGVIAILVLYKNARIDMKILDMVYGPMNWQRTHEVINGNLFCTIEIWDEDKKCWVKKQDVGVESNTEKEKGEASDSFKRAGVNVGIGRELYTSPFICVNLQDNEFYESGKDAKGKPSYKCYPSVKFSVSEMKCTADREICVLKIVDSAGKVRYSYNNVLKGTVYLCMGCGEKITEANTTKTKNGKPCTVDKHVSRCIEVFGTPLCSSCIEKRQKT